MVRFSTGQWEAFKAFTKIQEKDLELRKIWLEKQLEMNGVFFTEYDDDNNPVLFGAGGLNSYAAKLFEAYRSLGGYPETDMLLRTTDKPVFLQRSSAVRQNKDNYDVGGYGTIYSNGRRHRGDQRFDKDLGLSVERLKSWQLEAIKQKRERLEYKIKRALDYSDQLQREIEKINLLLTDIRVSVETQIVEVEIEMRTPGAANVVSNLGDIHGLDIGEVTDFAFDDALDHQKEQKERGNL